MLQNLKDNFIISTEKNKIDTATVYNFLSKESYWAKNITFEVVKKSIEGAYCFGLFFKDDIFCPVTFNTQIMMDRVDS